MKIYAAAAFVLFLFTKERFMYLCTILPQGGMFAFFTPDGCVNALYFYKKRLQKLSPGYRGGFRINFRML